MAKYTFVFGCGHEDTVELFGKGEERERKIAYFKEHGMCKCCFQEEKRKKREEEGIIMNAAFTPDIDEKTGDIMIRVWFSGNTYPYKEDFKSAGYRWSRGEGWEKTVSHPKFLEIHEKATQKGIKIIADPSSAGHRATALKKQMEWKERKNNI